jgi:hypothetical protein
MVSSLRYRMEPWWSARLLKTSLRERYSSDVKHLSLNLSACQSID